MKRIIFLDSFTNMMKISEKMLIFINFGCQKLVCDPKPALSKGENTTQICPIDDPVVSANIAHRLERNLDFVF